MSEQAVGGVRAPRQARSRETLDRLVDATAELLEERPFDEISVAEIVARADRTVGSFYARFDDKHAVLHCLMERVDARLRSVVRTFCDPVRWEGAPVADFVVESVRLNVCGYRRSSELFRAALVASVTDPRFRTLRADTLRYCARCQKEFLGTRRHELGCADAARASDRMFELVRATLDQQLLYGNLTETSPGNEADLVDELTHHCLHILRVPAAADDAPDLAAPRAAAAS